MRSFALLLVLSLPSAAQLATSQNTIDVNGEAIVKVVPDRVRLSLGVETRNKDLDAATAQNDTVVRRVLAVAQQFQIASGDLQTDYVHVDLAYDSHDGTVIDYYSVTKGVDIYLRDPTKFESLLKAALHAGANHVYDVEFSTSELRKYRVGLTFAHQYLHQLEPDVRHAALGNVGSMISFRVGAEDAPYLAREFQKKFDGSDLSQILNYHIYLKLLIDGTPSAPFSAVTVRPPACT